MRLAALAQAERETELPRARSPRMNSPASLASLASLASRDMKDTLASALEHTDEHAAFILADERTPLSQLLLTAYVECLPKAGVLLFDPLAPEAARSAFDGLSEGALVVMIQSSVFKIAYSSTMKSSFATERGRSR